ncbi:MAG: RluA family pseudouridine synthase [Desulfovibrionaceae bacterium]|nr:RluA family pseudouridine synthase [Desulfovibrionaceae bacterium]
MPGVAKLVVAEAEAGQKLLQFILRRLKRAVPESAVLRWIRTGQVRVDRGRKRPFDRLAAGQEVRLPPHHAAGPEAVARDLEPLDVVFENDWLVAVNKPGGLCSHGGTGRTDSAALRLSAMYPDHEFGPVLAHRLDRDTSGLLLAARTYAGLARLSALFRAGKVEKTYLAWVSGDWPQRGQGLMEDLLAKVPAGRGERVRAGSGRPARALIRFLASGPGASLVAVRLLTGRTHQIRAQVSERGFPVLGDLKYGGQKSGRGMLLHALGVRFEDVEIQAPVPWSGPFAVPEGLDPGSWF